MSDLSQEIDQRTARSLMEVEAERRTLSVSKAAYTPGGVGHWLNLGAWLALCWVLDPEGEPLSQRLENVTRD